MKRRWFFRFHFLVGILLCFHSSGALAADISFSLETRPQGESVIVKFENTGKDGAQLVGLNLELDGKIYQAHISDYLPSGTKDQVEVRIAPPEKPGTYPLYASLEYINERETFSISNVNYFHFRKPHQIKPYCGLKNVSLRDTLDFFVPYNKKFKFRLVLPKRIAVLSEEETPQGRRFTLKNQMPHLRSEHTIYAVLETDSSWPIHGTAVFEASLQTTSSFTDRSYFSALQCLVIGLLAFLISGGLYWKTVVKKQPFYPHPYLSSLCRFGSFMFLLFCGVLVQGWVFDTSPAFQLFLGRIFFLTTLVFLVFVSLPGKNNPQEEGSGSESLSASLLSVSLIRFTFSVFVISLLFFLLKTLYVIPDALLPHITPELFSDNHFGKWLHRALTTVLTWFYFGANDVEQFILYLADPLYVYMMLANLFVLTRYIKPDPQTDKYWHLLRSVFSFLSFGRSEEGGRCYWSALSKTGALAIAVKVFFLPLLSSWMIGGFIHQWSFVQSFQWEFRQINSYLVSLFILIDVTIFTFGYVVELPQLKNQIRSVEPTLLGWIVCVMCYPPFSHFSFQLFDLSLDAGPGGALSEVLSPIVQDFAVVLITILWGIYLWATIALGVRSSNLTNRGIVTSGPYGVVRHPAYASKVLLWGIEAGMFQTRALTRMFILVLIYGLRAWTEERHLKQDADYLLYKKKVRWMFVPGVW